MSRVTVEREVLRWAVNRSRVSPHALQRKFPKMPQWETGESQPTLRQLEALAKATQTPLGFFFLGKPPEERLPIPHFRTLADGAQERPSPDLMETLQMMQRRQSWMHDFMIEQGQAPLEYVQSASIGEDPQITADRIRRTLNMEEEWASKQPTWTEALRHLCKSIESVGILVVVNGIVGNNTHRKLNVEEFRGFVLVDEHAPLVFINGADGKAAQMFTLAHELAHVFFGSSAAFDLREMQPADDPMEQACNRIAAEFLIPEEQLRLLWPAVRGDPEPFQRIANRFKISTLVAARRALDVGLVDKAKFLSFYRDYQIDERRAAARGKKGGDFYKNQNLRVGQRFARAILLAAKEGKLLYSEAYQLTGLYGQAFDRYAHRVETGVRL